MRFAEDFFQDSAYTRDTVFNGQLALFQPIEGFRTNVDSLLLAAAVEADGAEHGIDVGSGCGGTALSLAHRLPQTKVTCLDSDKFSVHLGRRGSHANRLEDRVVFVRGQLEHYFVQNEARFDFLLTNPPYFDPGTICAPGRGKDSAFLNQPRLTNWVSKCLHMIRHKGRFYMIHRAAELANCLSALNERAGEITIRPVAPFVDTAAKRVIIRARKGLRKGEVRLLSPLILHQRNGEIKPTPTLLNVRQGGALPWT